MHSVASLIVANCTTSEAKERKLWKWITYQPEHDGVVLWVISRFEEPLQKLVLLYCFKGKVRDLLTVEQMLVILLVIQVTTVLFNGVNTKL